MLTYEQKLRTAQQITSEKSTVSRPNFGQNSEVNATSQLQLNAGNQSVSQQSGAKSYGTKGASNTTVSGHDFSDIPAFSDDAASRDVTGRGPRVIFHKEQSIEKPGEEEQTVDGGTTTPTTPATPTTAASCDCVPSSVQITNVSPYRSGDLYGHNFDVEVALTYSAATSGTGTDAQLFWFERTDRAPSWQGLSANVWNDMYALFPTSPTFDGWNNRTKPCPGNETATIHDPPAASVNLPARTLEFDIYVRGQQISHNAKAKQVLEPDGHGGIKTQTFEILPSALGPLAGP